MNRIAIFAHYDKDNKIKDYVIAYLQGLSEVTDKIIFVSDSEIKDDELTKIDNLVFHKICCHHGEYDFGSYKRGFLFLKENNLLNTCEELIFCNDSCYAPLFSFNNMFDKMSNKNSDFWGASKNIVPPAKIPHIQSFFIVFKPSVFNSAEFYKFITSITHMENKEKIIEKYECGMTKQMEDAGFTWDVYSEFSKKINNAYVYWYKYIIKQEKYCFLKRIIPNYKARICTNGLKTFINKNTNYNYSLIEQDIESTKIQRSFKWYIVVIYKLLFKIPYNYAKDIIYFYVRRFFL